MKKKLLNALRVRMTWRKYQIGIVTCPFDDQFHVAVVNPEGNIIDVYTPKDYDDYDAIAIAIDESMGERVEIHAPQTDKPESQEAINDD